MPPPRLIIIITESTLLPLRCATYWLHMLQSVSSSARFTVYAAGPCVCPSHQAFMHMQHSTGSGLRKACKCALYRQMGANVCYFVIVICRYRHSLSVSTADHMQTELNWLRAKIQPSSSRWCVSVGPVQSMAGGGSHRPSLPSRPLYQKCECIIMFNYLLYTHGA